jgi:hypothetical protein
MGIDTWVENFSCAVLKALQRLLPSVARVSKHIRYRPVIRMK